MIEDKKLETYKLWAPDQVLWTAWAKPVLFASMTTSDFSKKSIDIPKINWMSEVNDDTAVIIDLPGASGMFEAMALAQMGYRPVPLYNGCKGNEDAMLVNVSDITQLLPICGKIISELTIRTDAPPVFILDARRMKNNNKKPGKYDNRWCVFAQDMPSASYLLKHGITKVVVRSNHISDDLSHILCRYQEKGITTYLSSNKDIPLKTTVTKPSHFKSFLYRSAVVLKLTRNAAGGFGGKIPEPKEHRAGIGYRGMG